MAKNDDTEKSETKSKGLEKPLKKPLTFDHLKKQKKAKHKTVSVLLDPDLGDVSDEAEQEVVKLKKQLLLAEKSSSPAELKKLKGEKAKAEVKAEEAKEEMYAVTVDFKFKSIGRNTLDQLISDNSPSPKQIAEAKKDGTTDLQYDPEKFPQAMVAASMIEPDLSLEEVQEMWDDESWSTNELLALFVAAQEVNQHFRVVETKKG